MKILAEDLGIWGFFGGWGVGLESHWGSSVLSFLFWYDLVQNGVVWARSLKNKIKHAWAEKWRNNPQNTNDMKISGNLHSLLVHQMRLRLNIFNIN